MRQNMKQPTQRRYRRGGHVADVGFGCKVSGQGADHDGGCSVRKFYGCAAIGALCRKHGKPLEE